MIRIRNLTKIYHTKAEQVIALNNVNLNLPNRGFVVIVGKSGSGKTSLLNILACLDDFNDGEISVNNVSLKEFNQNKLDNYRNKSIGIVYQEFYLVEEFTVEENVAFALELQSVPKDAMKRRVNEILNLLSIQDLKDRKPFELSGGQKQRVAIARAIVKNPAVVLADEPTGNLDTETGEQILEVFKEISKEKLVIMVTHNREYAYNYGDRIIQIEDGKIQADDNNNNKSTDLLKNNNHEDGKADYKLPFSLLFKISLSSMLSKKIHSFIMILLLVFTMFFVGFSSNLSLYNPYDAIYKTFQNTDTNVIDIEKLQDEEQSFYTQEDINKLKSKYKDIYVSKYVVPYANLVDFYNPINEVKDTNFDSKGDYYTHQISKFVLVNNFDVIDEDLKEGRLPNKENEILITDYVAEMLISYGILPKDSTSVIGKYIMYNNTSLLIAGTIETDSQNYTDIKSSDADFEDFIEKLSSKYQLIYMNNDTFNNIKVNYDYEVFKNGGQRSVILSSNEKYKNNLILNKSRLPSTNNEIVISLFDAKSLLGEENVSYENLDVLETIIGTQYELNYINEYNEIEHKQYEVVGIFYSNIDNPLPIATTDKMYIITDDEMKDVAPKYGQSLEFHKNGLTINFSSSEKDNVDLIKYLLNNDNRIISKYSYLTDQIYGISTDTKRFSLYISVVFLTFSSLMIYYVFSIIISSKRRFIGILRSLGAKGSDVAKIFIFEGIIITAIVTIISNIIVYYLTNLVNKTFLDYISLQNSLVIFYYNPLTMVIVFMILFTLILMSTYIPVYRISKTSPIDVIKKG